MIRKEVMLQREKTPQIRLTAYKVFLEVTAVNHMVNVHCAHELTGDLFASGTAGPANVKFIAAPPTALKAIY